MLQGELFVLWIYRSGHQSLQGQFPRFGKSLEPDLDWTIGLRGPTKDCGWTLSQQYRKVSCTPTHVFPNPHLLNEKKGVTCIHLKSLTRSFSKNRRGCEGGFWGRGQSHTPKRSSMYGDSINVLRKILLSSIAEFQKSLKIEAIMGLRGTLSKLAKLLRNLPKLFFEWKAYEWGSHWWKKKKATIYTFGVMAFVYFCKEIAVNHPRTTPILRVSISNESPMP